MDDTIQGILLRLSVRQDERDWTLLVARVLGPIRSVVRRVVRRVDLADDACQEALITIHREVCTFRPVYHDRQRGEMAAMAWVLTIAHRAAIDLLERERALAARHRRYQMTQSLTGSAVASDAFAEEMEPDLIAHLRAGMSRLTPRHREILIGRYLDQASYEDIACQFGCSVSHARVRVSRALKLLARELRLDPPACGLCLVGLGPWLDRFEPPAPVPDIRPPPNVVWGWGKVVAVGLGFLVLGVTGSLVLAPEQGKHDQSRPMALENPIRSRAPVETPPVQTTGRTHPSRIPASRGAFTLKGMSITDPSSRDDPRLLPVCLADLASSTAATGEAIVVQVTLTNPGPDSLRWQVDLTLCGSPGDGRQCYTTRLGPSPGRASTTAAERSVIAVSPTRFTRTVDGEDGVPALIPAAALPPGNYAARVIARPAPDGPEITTTKELVIGRQRMCPARDLPAGAGVP